MERRVGQFIFRYEMHVPRAQQQNCPRYRNWEGKQIAEGWEILIYVMKVKTEELYGRLRECHNMKVKTELDISWNYQIPSHVCSVNQSFHPKLFDFPHQRVESNAEFVLGSPSPTCRLTSHVAFLSELHICST